MSIIQLMPGAKVWQNNESSVLFGVPPEIIKCFIPRKLPVPEYIVLPDTNYKNGVLQNSTEFPLYHFLFVQGNFFKGKKLTIIGNLEQIENNRKLLQLTLLGPSKKQYSKMGDSKYFNSLYKESRELALKKPDGTEAGIDDLINFVAFKNDVAEFDGITIKHESENIYSIENTKIDINFTEIQRPPYDVKVDYIPMQPGKFGVDVLGGASGFSPNSPCSGLLLNYNSDYMLLDAMPYMDYFLSARGVATESIKSIFLSHIHDDHCNMFPLVLFNDKVKFLGTKEIYWMAMKKLALQTGHKTSEFESYFDFVELHPYKNNEFYGMNIEPHYTVHSIPTIGATFRLTEKGREYSIVFVGDNKSLPDIQEMTDKQIVKEEKNKHLQKLYKEQYDLFFADGGQGLLHGDPRDSLNSKSDRIIFLHLDSLPKEFDTSFSQAEAGKRYMPLEGKEYSYMIKTMEILYKTFPGISESWLTTLMNNLNIVRYNAGDIIIKQGEISKGMIYIILTGNCSVKFHDGKTLREVARKGAGDFIGDMAIVRRTQKRSASVVASIPLTLCEIPEKIFYSFLVDEKRIVAIKSMWAKKTELEKLSPFNRFSDIVNEKIAKASKRIELKPGTKIIHENEKDTHFYIIIKGLFSVSKGGLEVNRLKPGEVFGEYGSLGNKLRNATIEAMEDAVVYEIKNIDINYILKTTPAFHFIINKILKERKENITK